MSFFRTRLSRVGMTRRSANTLLLLCTMFWGMSYALNKITSETLSPLEVMAIRYMLAGLICVFLFRRRLRRVDRQTLRDGTILALIAFVSITSIFYGLQVTEATTAAFLMSTSIIFVPLIQTVRLHRLPEPVILLCTALIFSLEPVFGAVYAFFLLGERLTPQGLCGTALVLLSVLIVSTHKTRK